VTPVGNPEYVVSCLCGWESVHSGDGAQADAIAAGTDTSGVVRSLRQAIAIGTIRSSPPCKRRDQALASCRPLQGVRLVRFDVRCEPLECLAA